MTDDEHEDSNNETTTEVAKGFFIGSILQVGGLLLMFLNPVALVFCGVIQLLYMLPGYFIARARGSSAGFLKGFALTAIILFLLNAACFGILALSMGLSGPWYG